MKRLYFIFLLFCFLFISFNSKAFFDHPLQDSETQHIVSGCGLVWCDSDVSYTWKFKGSPYYSFIKENKCKQI